MDAMTETARLGVWTPSGQILCVACDYAGILGTPRANHYPQHVAALARMDRTRLVNRPDDDLAAVCNACQCDCWVRSDVVLLQRVGYATSEIDWQGPFAWELQQTGGMCSALVYTTDTRQIVVTALDGNFVVGEYLATDQGWESPLGEPWESGRFYRDDDFLSDPDLAALVQECAGKVLAIVRAPIATQHESAAGALCTAGPDGMCTACGVEMTVCNVCQCVGYHREGCSQIDRADGNA